MRISKAIIKRAALWTVGGMAALILLVGIAVNLILTPERLTPIVRDLATEYVDGHVDVESVDAVFFSSFPHVGVRLRGVTVVSNALRDGMPDTVSYARRDTVLMFSEARVGLSLSHLLATGEVSIGRVYLSKPRVRLVVDSLGRANWDCIKSQAPDTLAEKSEEEAMPIHLKNIQIVDANITYSDRQSRQFFRAKGLNLEADGDINMQNLDIDLYFSDKSTYLALDGTRYLRKLPVGISGHVNYDLTSGCYMLSKTKMAIDRTELDVDGWVCPDSLGARAANVELRFALSTPDATQLFDYLPKDLIKQEIDISQGSLILDGSIIGRSSDTETPVVSCTMKVGGIKAHYEGMKSGIDDLTAEFNALLDAQKPSESYVNLDIFHFEGGQSEVEATVKVSSALQDPLVNCHLDAAIDLLSLSEVFPVENTQMGGSVRAKVDGSFRLADAQNLDLARLHLTGNMSVDSLKILNDSLGIDIRSNAIVDFDNKDTLRLNAAIDRLRYTAPGQKIRLRDLSVSGRTLLQRDTTRLATFIADLSARRLMVAIDSTRLFFRHFEAHPVLTHSDADPLKPKVSVSLKSDTITSDIYGNKGFTAGLETKVAIEKVDTSWVSNAMARFDTVRVRSPFYSLPIEVTDTYVSQAERKISIERMRIRAGHSSLNLTGTIQNLYYSLAQGKRLRTKLQVDADTLNCNELIGAVVSADEVGEQQSEAPIDIDTLSIASVQQPDTVVTDSIPQRIFSFPKNVRVGFGLKAKHLIWNKLEFDDVTSNVEIRRQALHLTNFHFRQGDSQSILTMAYKAHPDRLAADVKCFMRWERADIQKLIKALDLDTVVPVLAPLSGVLDCYMAAELEVDTAWNFDLSKSRASMHLSGKKMTIMDGENFAKISKVLMFKNKKENVVDTVSLNVLVEDGRIEILPFIANIDRYRAIVGGSQDFDMNLNYHVSVVKSPLPFKAGVNLTGTPDDINIDVTRAKLKGYNNREAQLENDTISLDVRMDILRKSYFLSGIELPAALRREGDTIPVRRRRRFDIVNDSTAIADSLAAVAISQVADSIAQ